jgi:hypothetical protein
VAETVDGCAPQRLRRLQDCRHLWRQGPVDPEPRIRDPPLQADDPGFHPRNQPGLQDMERDGVRNPKLRGPYETGSRGRLGATEWIKAQLQMREGAPLVGAK